MNTDEPTQLHTHEPTHPRGHEPTQPRIHALTHLRAHKWSQCSGGQRHLRKHFNPPPPGAVACRTPMLILQILQIRRLCLPTGIAHPARPHPQRRTNLLKNIDFAWDFSKKLACSRVLRNFPPPIQGSRAQVLNNPPLSPFPTSSTFLRRLHETGAAVIRRQAF